MKKKIGVIGLGYVGLPLAINFGKKNFFEVYGFDEDDVKLKLILEGKSYINHIKSSEVKNFIKKNKVTKNYSHIKNLDLIILCLPTPLKPNLKPDLSYIKKSLKKIIPFLRKNQTLSLESSTYPGTTEEVIVKNLEKKFKIGKNFYIVYSPEREDPGNKIQMRFIPKVLSGYTKNCSKIGEFYYSKVFKNVLVSKNLKTAEFSKILENVFRSINIGLVNEIKIISDKMGVDIFEIIKTASSKPFGFMPFYPGPGVGGHCIPLDPFYLKWKANRFGLKTKFIELAHKTNLDIKKFILAKMTKYLKDLNNKKVLIIGVAYKKNIDDCRESPSLTIISELIKRKSKVSYHDPFVKTFPTTRKHKINLKSIEINKKNLKFFDCVVILTDHDNINYKLIKQNSKIIFDSRGIWSPDEKVIRI